MILPLAGIRILSEPTARLTVSPVLDETCQRTEPTFVDALWQIAYVEKKGRLPRTPSPRRTIHDRMSVYTDEQGSPLILRKQRDSRLGITLSNILLNDALVVPAGTFVGVDSRDTTGITDQAAHAYQQAGKHTPRERSFHLFTVSSSFAIRPLRIGPWAYDDPIRRAFFAIERRPMGERYDRGRARQIISHTLADFQQAAERIIRLCRATSQ